MLGLWFMGFLNFNLLLHNDDISYFAFLWRDGLQCIVDTIFVFVREDIQTCSVYNMILFCQLFSFVLTLLLFCSSNNRICNLD
jgi:hypothetical protein